jgi:hypothetical protein
MIRRTVTAAAILATWASGASVPAGDAPGATGPTAAPTTQPATTQPTTTRPTTRPAASRPTTTRRTKSRAELLLEALEAAGEKYPSIKAKLAYEVVNRMLGDTERRSGWVAYRKGSEKQPARFRIHFATLRLDQGALITAKVDYAFDGRQLTIAKHRIKQIKRYRLALGQRADPMKLGRGPFPLPFGQTAEDMLKRFRAATRPPAAGDPKGTDYLKLTPREAYREQLNVSQLEMWVDRKLHLPVKLVARDDKKKLTTTVTFSDVDPRAKLEASVFRFAKPAGWRETVQDLKQGVTLTP